MSSSTQVGSTERVAPAAVVCAHCATPVPPGPSFEKDGKAFCCAGCVAVYDAIHSLGLGEYYSLRDRAGSYRKASPASAATRSFSYLDDAEFLKLYCDAEGGARRMTFYLEGIHCVACLWLLERLPQFVPGLRRVAVDMSRSTATATADAGASFAAIAAEFDRLGYRPHPVRDREDEALRRKDDRLLLIRVAVAGTVAMNVMLMAISTYAGLQGPMLKVFGWMSLLLFLPVLLFSAVPFYKGALSALRARAISIDVPISLGVVVGFASSALNVARGSAHVYFDSLATLVFLLLASRFVLKRVQQGAVESSSLLHFLTPSTARVLVDGAWAERDLDAVKAGALVEVRPGENVPIDGVVAEGESFLNCALLTGESEAVAVKPGAAVFAGTTNVSAPLRVTVGASGYETRLGRILRDVEQSSRRRARIATRADAVSKYFVWAVLVLSAAAYACGLRLGPQEAFNRALAMVIVTCPCGLALATPLALTVSIGKAARAGMLIKGADVIERLDGARTVFLDKTGTVTEGALSVLGWSGRDDDDVRRAVLALESRSVHPIARALVAHLRAAAGDGAPPEVADFREISGVGVSGTVEGELYAIGASASSEQSGVGTRVCVRRDGLAVAEIELGDRLRPGSRGAADALRALGLRVRLLSGDRPAAVTPVAEALAVAREDALGGASPEEKRRLVEEAPRAVMVGDGANDAVALSAAYVGVAAHGGMEVSLRAADVYLSRPGVAPVRALVVVGRETMRTIRRNLIFSVAYNAVGIVAAFSGRVDPLFAAVLMPLSALSVFLSSMSGTRALRAVLRLEDL